MMEILQTDYIKFAKARGIKKNIVNYKHALKNGLIFFSTPKLNGTVGNPFSLLFLISKLCLKIKRNNLIFRQYKNKVNLKTQCL